jgi:hypothetical protein
MTEQKGRGHLRVPALALAGCALVALAGCGADGPDGGGDPRTVLGARGAVEFTAAPLAPPAEGPNDFRLSLRQRPSGEPLAGATIDVRAVMPSMGHEAQGDPIIEEGEPGVYDVHDLVFSMPGTWEVRFLAEAAPVQDEAAFVYEVR